MGYPLPLPYNLPVAHEYDIESISIKQDGTGSVNVVFEINAFYGATLPDLDPDLPVELDIHLFDKYHSDSNRLLLKANFGIFLYGLAQAQANGKVTQEEIDNWTAAAIQSWLSQVAIANQAIELAEKAQVELAAVGITVNWPVDPITKET